MALCIPGVCFFRGCGGRPARATPFSVIPAPTAVPTLGLAATNATVLWIIRRISEAMATLRPSRPGSSEAMSMEGPNKPNCRRIPSAGFAIFLKNEANHALASLAAIPDMAGRARRLPSKRQRNPRAQGTFANPMSAWHRRTQAHAYAANRKPELSGPRSAARRLDDLLHQRCSRGPSQCVHAPFRPAQEVASRAATISATIASGVPSTLTVIASAGSSSAANWLSSKVAGM
jgi:hypothetical protein